MSRKVDLSSNATGNGTSGEVALDQKPQQQQRTGGVPGGVKKSSLIHEHVLAFHVLVF